ncbi:hypothetical protein DPMN_117874 [Dreissena polymorpha]|uniref:Uncharacterized protein n=1 Tax=Dreissena polymorpha TaxID=45954 RepID=A0A9D4GJ41_DREPO|nr:hypothetical protein DPMN_117874 [Dreissena polymorpha]
MRSPNIGLDRCISNGGMSWSPDPVENIELLGVQTTDPTGVLAMEGCPGHQIL